MSKEREEAQTHEGIGLGSDLDGLESSLVGEAVHASVESTVENELLLENRGQAEHGTRVLGNLHDLRPGLLNLSAGVDTNNLSLALALELLEERADEETGVGRAGDTADDDGVEEDAEGLLLLLNLEERFEQTASTELVQRCSGRDVVRLSKEKRRVSERSLSISRGGTTYLASSVLDTLDSVSQRGLVLDGETSGGESNVSSHQSRKLDVPNRSVDSLLVLGHRDRAGETVERDPGLLNGDGLETVRDGDSGDGSGVVWTRGRGKGNAGSGSEACKEKLRRGRLTGLNSSDGDKRVASLVDGIGDEVLKLLDLAESKQRAK